MTEKEEQFLHFVQCIQCLNNAWVILQDFKHIKTSPSIMNAAFQFALIEYSKPYKCSRGSLLNTKGKQTQYKLNTEHIPKKHSELHNRIIGARDQIHAHSDLSVLEAKIYVKNTPYGKITGHIQNKIIGTEELHNLDSIIDLIELTLDSMYKKEKKMERELPLTS